MQFCLSRPEDENACSARSKTSLEKVNLRFDSSGFNSSIKPDVSGDLVFGLACECLRIYDDFASSLYWCVRFLIGNSPIWDEAMLESRNL